MRICDLPLQLEVQMPPNAANAANATSVKYRQYAGAHPITAIAALLPVLSTRAHARTPVGARDDESGGEIKQRHQGGVECNERGAMASYNWVTCAMRAAAGSRVSGP